MAVLMFMAKLAPKVRDGSKRHTVRPERKRPIKLGDRLSLRRWQGKAYRSKQVKLRAAVCTKVEPLRLTRKKLLSIGGKRLNATEAEAFAKADGLESFLEFAQFLEQAHGLPFKGQVIHW